MAFTSDEFRKAVLVASLPLREKYELAEGPPDPDPKYAPYVRDKVRLEGAVIVTFFYARGREDGVAISIGQDEDSTQFYLSDIRRAAGIPPAQADADEVRAVYDTSDLERDLRNGVAQLERYGAALLAGDVAAFQRAEAELAKASREYTKRFTQ